MFVLMFVAYMCYLSIGYSNIEEDDALISCIAWWS